MRLLIVRHGTTDHNALSRYTGQSDIELSTLGESQVEALGLRLASERLDVIISSDLIRARQTTHAVMRHHQVPIIFDPDLREISMGAWEGLTYAEVWERDPVRAAEWHSDALDVAPPGGETILAFHGRLVRAFDRCRQSYPDASVLWVTHGGAIGVLLCHLLGMNLNRRWQFRRDNAAINELDVGIAGGSVHQTSGTDYFAIAMRLNDTCHLENILEAGDDHSVEARQVL